MSGPLREEEIRQTAAWISSVQLGSGMIPWYPGGHADPWNHTEAAMALAVGGFVREAERAYEWLADTQLPDGSWCLYYLAEGIEEPRRDPNVCAYIATGVWWHYLVTGDEAVIERFWPVVERAIEFVLRLRKPGGEIAWSLDVDGAVGRIALLTANSSILHSLRCAVAIADHIGVERPEWELAASRLRHVIAYKPDAFEAKSRWAMDWYYPVLGGALRGERAIDHLQGKWDEFVMPGVGVRCVVDEPWITAAESAECVMALDASGLEAEALALIDHTRHMRAEDGSYWTGCVHPKCVRYPGGERSTYSAAAVVLASHVLNRSSPASLLFAEGALLDLIELEELADRMREA